MMKTTRLATKAQATAVREYLATLGTELSHVQALEVIARGEGMRSRHLLANSKPAVLKTVEGATALHRTEVTYSYTDGSNCKRIGSMVFRGRILPEQLLFIEARLDEKQFFVPAQVGFECLHFAFSDFGGDDHFWHSLELTSVDHWNLDPDGFVLDAGAVRQLAPGEPGVAGDADTENLFFRFARVQQWKPELQRAAYEAGWQPPEQNCFAGAVTPVMHRLLAARPELSAFPRASLEEAVSALLDRGFTYDNMRREFKKPLLPNSYFYAILEECTANEGLLALNYDASTHSGQYLSESPLLHVINGGDEVWAELDRRLHHIARDLRITPAAWDAAFE